MFKKLINASIAASILLAIPVSANHHRSNHGEKIEVNIGHAHAEKAKEKSKRDKFIAGFMQFTNKLSWLVAVLPAYGAYALTVPSGMNANDAAMLRCAVITVATYGISWAVIKTGTAAAISQEGDKPLNK